MNITTLDQLVMTLNKLPTITKKQAERLAYYLVTSYQEQGLDLIDAIQAANTKVKHCKICDFLTDDEPICYICADQDQNRRQMLVVVETALDVIKFEKTKNINAFYHVLGKLVNVAKKVDFSDLNIDKLMARANQYQEVVLALSPNLDGIVTANLLKEMLKGVKVTQLAQGIPLGAAMEYVDEMTLKIALDNRKELK